MVTKAKKKVLSKRELATLVKKFPKFQISESGDKAKVTCKFATHIDAIVFLARLAVHSEVLSLYPKITLQGNKVGVTLGSTPKEPLSGLDLKMMERISHFLPD